VIRVASVIAHRGHSGAFIVLVGPDGVGKTSVARALANSFGGPTAYFHFMPPLRRQLLTKPPAHEATRRPVINPTGSRVLGWCRLIRNWGRCWIGYAIAIRPALRRGSLVIADRWAYGYVVQPAALRFYGPASLATAAIGLLPRPDLVVNLSAPSEVVLARKQELTRAEISRELMAWSQLPYCPMKTFDATEDPASIAVRILEAL
jgi:ATPase family associated with various cellular activities (AAA)